MRCSEQPPIVVDAEPEFGRRGRPLPIPCGTPLKSGSTFGAYGATLVATHRLERKHPAPQKEVAYV
jgi:hypothetical protein